MKVLITGGSGQAGNELIRVCPDGCELAAPSSHELDIRSSSAVAGFVKKFMPDVIINAAAYTAVDQAESEPERAFAINADGPANIASAAEKTGARLVHISTDFVFDGMKSRPYLPADTARPLNVYGRSKLQGEQAVLDVMPDSSVIIRTSWLYSSYGGNFVKTMLKLMSERKELRVVADQAGTPTWARGLAEAVWKLALMPEACGIFHWSDSGIASWYDFACVIAEKARAAGLVEKLPSIIPVCTEDFPTAARRPSYSVLDKHTISVATGMMPPHWQASLENMLAELEGI